MNKIKHLLSFQDDTAKNENLVGTTLWLSLHGCGN